MGVSLGIVDLKRMRTLDDDADVWGINFRYRYVYYCEQEENFMDFLHCDIYKMGGLIDMYGDDIEYYGGDWSESDKLPKDEMYELLDEILNDDEIEIGDEIRNGIEKMLECYRIGGKPVFIVF